MKQENTKISSDNEIDLSEIPELDETFFENATIRLPERKRVISLRLDPDVLDWYKKKGKGYQTRINAVLKAYMQAKKKVTHDD